MDFKPSVSVLGDLQFVQNTESRSSLQKKAQEEGVMKMKGLLYKVIKGTGAKPTKMIEVI